MSFTFRERHSRKDYGIVSRTPSSLFPPIENRLVDVPGGHGAYSFGHRYGPRILPVPIEFKWKDLSDYQSRVNMLAEWLSPGTEPEPLVFDMEPDKTYFAELDDSTDLEKIGRLGQGELIFICSDPFKYGREQSQSFSSSTMIANEGTMDAYPIFRTTITEDVTLFRIENRSNLTPQGTPRAIVLGRASSPSQETIEREQLVMHDTMRSTQSWQTATEIDNGFIAGEMDAGPNGFYARLYGVGIESRRWQGPSLIKAIGQSLQDFRADIFIRQMNSTETLGMIEVYFRDANGNRVAKIGFEDAWRDIAENQGKVRIGPGSNYHDIYTKADTPWGWNRFDGIIRLQREGNVWTPYFAQIMADGRHNWVRGTLRYTDNEKRAMAPITHIQVAIRKFPGLPETDQSIKEIKIYKINKVTNPDEQVPLSFKAGDIVEINKGLVTVNGEERTDLIELQTDFFTLVEGLNQISVSPSFPTTVSWRNRYL